MVYPCYNIFFKEYRVFCVCGGMWSWVFRDGEYRDFLNFNYLPRSNEACYTYCPQRELYNSSSFM